MTIVGWTPKCKSATYTCTPSPWVTASAEWLVDIEIEVEKVLTLSTCQKRKQPVQVSYGALDANGGGAFCRVHLTPSSPDQQSFSSSRVGELLVDLSRKVKTPTSWSSTIYLECVIVLYKKSLNRANTHLKSPRHPAEVEWGIIKEISRPLSFYPLEVTQGTGQDTSRSTYEVSVQNKLWIPKSESHRTTSQMLRNDLIIQMIKRMKANRTLHHSRASFKGTHLIRVTKVKMWKICGRS